MSILTMSSAEVRRRVKYLNSTALWGRDGGRQFGSLEDLRLAQLERVNWQRFTQSMVSFAAAMSRSMLTIAEAARSLALVGLAAADHMGEELRQVPRSWEVEREGFMRGMGE